MPNRSDEIDPIPDDIDIRTVYMTVREARDLSRRVAKHVLSESEPEAGMLWRLKAVEGQSEQNSRDITSIKTIPLRLALVAVVAIVGTAAVGVATLVWNARPAAQSTKATP